MLPRIIEVSNRAKCLSCQFVHLNKNTCLLHQFLHNSCILMQAFSTQGKNLILCVMKLFMQNSHPSESIFTWTAIHRIQEGYCFSYFSFTFFYLKVDRQLILIRIFLSYEGLFFVSELDRL